jgi:phosphate transport system permease protein
MTTLPTTPESFSKSKRTLLLSERANRVKRLVSFSGQALLFLVTLASALAVLFIFYYITRDAVPFFTAKGFKEFFTSTAWFPSGEPAEFGALAIFFGSAIVTLGAVLVAVPLGVAASVCLSDILPFSLRQLVKPVIEMLAAIPSVAFGFFALVVFAPKLQEHGGYLLSIASWLIGIPVLGLSVVVLSELAARWVPAKGRNAARVLFIVVMAGLSVYALAALSGHLSDLHISSGTNALNVSVILGIMALPTIVSVSEDALQAAGVELREAGYSVGATRAETILRVVIPAAGSGIAAAIILGIMRVVGETMVVWMASGNAAHIPHPWYNFLEPIRTMTATIAGDMGEADQVTGSARYHVLFALALCLLAFSLACNVISEWIVARSKKRMGR